MSTRPSITGRRWGEEEEKANKKKNNYIVLPEQEQAVVLYKICSEEQVIQIIINSKQQDVCVNTHQLFQPSPPLSEADPDYLPFN